MFIWHHSFISPPCKPKVVTKQIEQCETLVMQFWQSALSGQRTKNKKPKPKQIRFITGNLTDLFLLPFRQAHCWYLHNISVLVFTYVTDVFFSHLPSVLASKPSTSIIASLSSSLSLWISCNRTPFLLRMSSSSERSSGLRSTGTRWGEKKKENDE